MLEGEAGPLVAPRDPQALVAALGELLGDAARRAAFGEAARRGAERLFSIPAMLAGYEVLYRELLPSLTGPESPVP